MSSQCQYKDAAIELLGTGNCIDMRDLEKLLPKGWEIEDWELITDKDDSPGWYSRHIRIELITMMPTSSIARPFLRRFIAEHWCWSGIFDIDLICKMDHQLVRVRHFAGETISDVMSAYRV